MTGELRGSAWVVRSDGYGSRIEAIHHAHAVPGRCIDARVSRRE